MAIDGPGKPGRTIFIRDNDSGEFWSIGHHPGAKHYDTYQAVHGLGYTTVSSSAQKIDSSVTFFVPNNDPCEIWQLKINNNERKKRRLSVFVYFDLPPITASDTLLKNNSLFINSKGGESGNSLLFFALDKTIDSFDTDKEIFIGPYRSIDNPRALEDGKCSRSLASTDPIAVIQKNITMGANSTSELQVIVGGQVIDRDSGSFQTGKSQAIRRAETIIDKYRRVHVGENALAELKKNWQVLEDKIRVNTPDDAMNVSFNYWAKYQNIVAGNINHRRDNTANAAKQLVTLLPLMPDLLEKKLLSLFERQFKEGRTVEYIDTTSSYAKVSDSIDGPAWLIIATSTYIAETGADNLLKKQIKYFDGGSGSILEHLIRAAKYCLAQLNSSHLIATKSEESTLATAQVVYAIRELLPLLSAAKEHDLTRTLTNRLDQISQSFNRRMWDGGWYLARRNSRKIGTKKNTFHKIDLEAQVWAVIAGLASSERAEKSLNSAWRALGSPAGVVNLQPAYLKYDPENPESQFTAGERFNSGVNLSLSALLMAAETKLGRGELAYKIFQQHSHIYRSDNQENYKVEPYIYPSFINGPSSSAFGRGDGAWQKNPGGWIWKIILEQILGCQPVIGGIKIDPCIPRDWRQVEYSRTFRGVEYHIRIINPTRQTKGVERVTVDGIRQTGNVIKAFSAGVHYVEVFLD